MKDQILIRFNGLDHDIFTQNEMIDFGCIS